MVGVLCAIGVIAIVVFLIRLHNTKEENDRRETERLRQLLVGNIMLSNSFERFWAAQKLSLTYEQALRKFFADPETLRKAEREKEERDKRNRDWDERQKKETTLNRIYAYKYEDFLFSLYSPLAIYSEYFDKWTIPTISFEVDTSLPEEYIIVRMKEAGYKNVNDLFREFIQKDLLLTWDKTTHRYHLGSVLSDDANIVSETDYNMDKWIKEHGQSSTRDELMKDLTRD